MTRFLWAWFWFWTGILGSGVLHVLAITPDQAAENAHAWMQLLTN